MNGRAWAYEEEKKIMSMREKGASYKEIGNVIGRTTGSVRARYNLIQKFGYTKPVEEEKMTKCPICGSRDIRKVDTVIKRDGFRATKGQFCRNCLTEFVDGKALEPLA